jgi:hypothetical protein
MRRSSMGRSCQCGVPPLRCRHRRTRTPAEPHAGPPGWRLRPRRTAARGRRVVMSRNCGRTTTDRSTTWHRPRSCQGTGERADARRPVPRQNVIRRAQQHGDPSIRPQAQDPRAWSEVGRPASLNGGLARSHRSRDGGRGTGWGWAVGPVRRVRRRTVLDYAAWRT